MTNEASKSRSGGSVTVERNGARSVDLGRVLNTPRAQEQLKQISQIQRNQSDRGGSRKR
jgi:hypothetical protein